MDGFSLEINRIPMLCGEFGLLWGIGKRDVFKKRSLRQSSEDKKESPWKV